MGLFVKWNCGCIGFNPSADTEGRKKAIIVYPCDLGREDDPGDLHLFYRNMGDKRYMPLTPREEGEMWAKMRRVIADGNDMRRVRQVMQRTT